MKHLHSKFINLKTGSDLAGVLRAPAGETESVKAIFEDQATEKIYRLWMDILHIRDFGVQDSFFKLGGNSLKATQLVSRICKEFEVKITLNDIFNHVTVAQQVELVENSPTTDYESITRIPDASYYPLSEVQHGMWLVCQDPVASNAYNNIVVRRVRGRVFVDRLGNAFRMILERHEILRTNFMLIEGIPRQVVHEHPGTSLIFIDMPADRGGHGEVVRRESAYVFNQETESLIRLTLLKLDDEEYVLMLNMHHLVIDGWSCGILLDELTAVYHSFVNGSAFVLPELPIQYRDYASWYNALLSSGQMKRHKEYWSANLISPPERVNLPALQTFSGRYDHKGDTLEVIMGEDLTGKIEKFCVDHGLSYYVGLLTMIKVLCYKYTGQEDMIIGSMASGRIHRDIEDQVGYYATTLPIRSRIAPEATVRSYAHQLREVVIAAQANQIYPYTLIVNDLKEKTNRNGLFNVVVNYHEAMDIMIENTDVLPYELRRGTSKVELLFDIRKIEGRFHFDIEYSSMLYNAEIIGNLAFHLQQLAGIVVAMPEIRIIDIDL